MPGIFPFLFIKNISHPKFRSSRHICYVKEYSEYLNSKYSCLKPASGSSVVINPNLLAKAAGNEKTAEWLEYHLGLMPDVIDKIYGSAAYGSSAAKSDH